MAELGHKDLSGQVIEAAIAVHASLGPGFIESVYENALCVELAARGISFEQQKVIQILHRGIAVGEHRLDLLVEGVLLVELKAVKEIEDVFFAIGRSQMKAAGIRDGVILNFAPCRSRSSESARVCRPAIVMRTCETTSVCAIPDSLSSTLNLPHG
jgi:GxxExxY protein